MPKVYETLIEKTQRCRITALKSETESARKLWMDKANQLEFQAGNLPVVKAICDSYQKEKDLQRK